MKRTPLALTHWPYARHSWFLLLLLRPPPPLQIPVSRPKLQSWGPNSSLKAQVLAWRPRCSPWSPNLSLEVPIPPKRPRSQPQNSERGLVCLSFIGSSIMLELKVQKCTYLNEIAVVIISLCVCAKKLTFYSFETAKNWSFETAKNEVLKLTKKTSF